MNKVSSAVERVKDVFQGWHILQWVCMGVWILAVIIIGIMSMKVSSARDQFEVEYAQNAATISSLRTELESFDNAKQNDADEIKVTAKSAYTAGVKVAFAIPSPMTHSSSIARRTRTITTLIHL